LATPLPVEPVRSAEAQRGSMAQIEGEIIIGRPSEVVFDFVADERNEPSFTHAWCELNWSQASRLVQEHGSELRRKSMGRVLEMTLEYTR